MPHLSRLALAAAVGWLYADIGVGLVVQWATNPDASYGVILAAVAGLLIWRRRKSLRAAHASAASTVAGLLLVLTALALFLVGHLAADMFTTRVSGVLLFLGLIWFGNGTHAARASLAPASFLLLAIPLPELLVTTLTGGLQSVAAGTAEGMLTTVGIPVYRDGNVLELPTVTLQVVEACSGLRSVVSLVSVGLLLSWASGGTPPRRLGLVVLAVPIAVAVNSLRLAVIGAAAEHWGDAALRDPWHSLMGWATFGLSLVVLVGVQRLLSPAAQVQPMSEVVRA
ncbi:MAG: exosortase/archaeosortase family protein [Vicinamibacterales bacterium]